MARPGEILTVGSTASFEALNASSLVSCIPITWTSATPARASRDWPRSRMSPPVDHRSEGTAEIEDGHAGQRRGHDDLSTDTFPPIKYLFIAEPPTDFVYLPYRQRKPQRMIMIGSRAGRLSSTTRALPLSARMVRLSDR